MSDLQQFQFDVAVESLVAVLQKNAVEVVLDPLATLVLGQGCS